MPKIAKVLLLATIGLATLSSLARAEEPSPRHTPVSRTYLIRPDGIEWRTFRAVEAAVAEANRNGSMKPAACSIWAVEDADGLTVVFSNPQPTGSRWKGCPPGPCRCFQVELEPTSLKVKSAHFSK